MRFLKNTEKIMTPIYCFTLDEYTGHIDVYKIEKYVERNYYHDTGFAYNRPNKQGYQARFDFRKSQIDRLVNWRVYSYDPSLEHATQIMIDGLKERQKDFEFKEKKYRNALEQMGVAI